MSGAITPLDVQALMGLLRRLPMSDAETLYANGLIERLAQIAQQAATDHRPPTTDEASAPDRPE